jgi:GST-like protein
MHVLYGIEGSGAAAVEVALERCAVPYRVVTSASWEPTSALDELARVNPLKQIPTLVFDDGTVMTESAAILIELGLRHPVSGLIPTEPAARARVLRGLVFIAANCYAAVSVSDYPERWTAATDDAARSAVRAAARAQLHRAWEIFADQFPATPFFSGAEPGALDILAATVSKWSGTRAHVRRTRPAFLATVERIEQHPTVKPVFDRHWP